MFSDKSLDELTDDQQLNMMLLRTVDHLTFETESEFRLHVVIFILAMYVFKSIPLFLFNSEPKFI